MIAIKQHKGHGSDPVTSSDQIAWTNKSVLLFAGDADPIEAIERKARDVVNHARDAGWSGPPFNPVFIAQLMNVPVEANSNVADARTVCSESGPRIEFNPKQARERVRFSIAHEIAHMLFSDFMDRTRNRGGTRDITDDWQLELLCNLAASEFVMPFGSLPTKTDVPPIEELMVERRKFDVSAEAFLIRVVKSSTQPLAMFCASPIAETPTKRRYRVDYFVPSVTAKRLSVAGRRIPNNSVIHRCTAIGYTDSAEETWVDRRRHLVECVGIPGYPGSSLPRVAGMIRYDSRREDTHPIRYVHGNALDPRGDNKRLLCQMVNDRAHKWGGGIARRAAHKYPQAEKEFAKWFAMQTSSDRLGKVHFSSEMDGIVIASLVAQEGYGKSSLPRIRYSALESCLRTVAEHAIEQRLSIHMPRIGTGAAGGTWEAVEELIDECIVAKGLHVTVYDLPPRRQQLGLFD